MSNSLFDKGREKFLTGSISWTGDTIKAVLVDGADYTPNLASDEFLSSIPVAARVAITAALSSKTATAGVADAADTVFTAVSGDPSELVVLFKDTGDAATSPLIALIDNAGALTVTPNGNDINCVWSNAAEKIFKL